MKIVGGTCIAVADGRNSVNIENPVGEEFPVYCYDFRFFWDYFRK